MLLFTERKYPCIIGQKKDPGEFNLRQNMFKEPQKDVQVLDLEWWKDIYHIYYSENTDLEFLENK